MKVALLQTLPPGLLDLDATELASALGGPALIHVTGQQEPPVLVSVLLHGNETSGWDGVRQLLQRHPIPARSVILLIGNVAAAAQGVRKLPHQQDFNRIWQDAGGEEGQLRTSVMAALDGVDLHAVVDLHNNTGWNPVYGLVSQLDADSLGIATLFSHRVVHIIEPVTTLARAFDHRCPAVTMELGPVGVPAHVERVTTDLETLLTLPHRPAPNLKSLTLYRSLGRVEIADCVPFSFLDEQPKTPLVLTGSEEMNFRTLAEGSLFAVCEQNNVLRVTGPGQHDITSDCFVRMGNRIVTRKPLVVAMYTMSKPAISQDCLCYFMEEMTLPIF